MRAEFIISRPERQKPLQRTLFTFITIVAWTLWISMWLPALTLVAWLLGMEDAYQKLGLIHPMHAAKDFSIVVIMAVACALSIGSWSQYNRIRFSGRQRRRHNQPLDISEMAPVLGASVEAARQLRVGRRSVICFAKDGGILLGEDADRK